MTADLFRRDYRQMKAEGVEFTVDDIVRLNALAVKVERSASAANAVLLPRCAFLGRLVLREPTVAHEVWLEEAARYVDCADDNNFLWLHGYALSQKASELADATRPEKVIRAVYKFAVKKLCGFTRRQLQGAVEYALFGNESLEIGAGGDAPAPREDVESGRPGGPARGAPETFAGRPAPHGEWPIDGAGGDAPAPREDVESGRPETLAGRPAPHGEWPIDGAGGDAPAPRDDVESRTKHTAQSTKHEAQSPALGLIIDAKAVRLPLTLEDCQTLTASELEEAISRALILDKRADIGAARNRAMGDYVRAREAVRGRARR